MKSKKLSRILAVLLLITLLAGFAPTAPADPADVDESKAVVLEEGNDAGVTDGDNPVTEPGENNDPAPEPGNDPAPEPGNDPAPEPGDDPAPEPGGEPQSVSVKVAFDPAVLEVKAGEEALENGGEVESGTALTIKPTEAYASAKVIAVTANDAELTATEGVYSLTAGEEDITLNAFGVKDAQVSDANAWTKSKTVTVNTFGEVKSVALLDGDEKIETKNVSGNKVEFGITNELSETGKTFTLQPSLLTKAELDAETPETLTLDSVDVTVKMIDTTKPSASFNKEIDQEDVFETKTGWGGYKYEEYVETIYTVHVSDRASGIASITAQGYRGSWERDFIPFDIESYDAEAGTYVFRANKNRNQYFIITITDKAGNVREINTDSGAAPFDLKSPEITAVIVGSGDGKAVEKDYIGESKIWIGPNSTIRVQAESTVMGVSRIQLNDETHASSGEDVTFPAGILTAEDETATFYAYDKYSELDPGTKSFEVSYDNAAPTFEPSFKINDQDVFEKIVHAVTGGLLYHKTVTVQLGSLEDEGSGVGKVFYTIELDGESAGEEMLAQVDENNCFDVDLSNYSGSVKITVTVYDKVGNASETKTATFKVNGDDGSEVEQSIVTQDATSRDKEEASEAKLVVFAYSSDKPYTAQNKDGEDNWVKNVEFDVRYKSSGLTSNKPDDKDVPDEGGTYYLVTSPVLTVSFENNQTVPYTAENNGDGVWTVKVGTDDTAYSDNVYFAVTQTIKKYTATVTPAVPDDPATENVDESKPRSVSWTEEDVSSQYTPNNPVPVLVHIQNFIAAATVTDVGTPTDDGWFNGLDHQIGDVTVTAPTSVAPAWTDYLLEYCAVGTNEWKTVAATKGYDGELPSMEPNTTISLSNYLLNGSDGFYRLSVKTHDILDNTPENETPQTDIKFDQTPADIYVVFSEDSHASDNGKFYDRQRTATIKIFDATFTEADGANALKEKVDKTYGANAETLQDWTFEAEKSGGGTWTKVLTYGVKTGAPKDGDNYELTVSAVDVAGNTSSTAKDGTYTGNKEKASDSHYSADSSNTDLFTVDQTAPVVSVEFSNNAARNGKYFNAGRTATITVVEHNFDESRVTLETPGSSGRSEWSHNGDTHTMTVSYNSDAQNCSISINVVDKAGNVCPDAAVNYGNSVAVKDFVIDQTRPNVTYTGVDQSPYSDVCTPGFTSTDANLGNEFTYTIRCKNLSGDRDMKDVLPGGGSSASFSLNDIPQDPDFDGIYTMSVTVTDLAGNVTTLEPVEFAVNRFGSIYTLSNDLQNAVGKYLSKDGWAKASKGDLTITEYNPTELKDDARLDIYRDGVRVKSYTGAELKKLVSGGNRGSVGLYEYIYKLPVEDFAEDGVYRVVVSSTDGSDHKSANDAKGAEVSFVIDTVAPEIVSITGLEKQTVNAKKQTVDYQILDTYGLDRVTVRVDGPDGEIFKEYISQAVLDAQNGKLESYQELLPEGELDLSNSVDLPERNTPYHVVISVTDKAGNTSVADGGTIIRSTEEGAYTPAFDFLDSVTVSTNFFVRYIHNTGALIGTGVGAAAVAGGLWLILAKRRKKDEKEAA